MASRINQYSRLLLRSEIFRNTSVLVSGTIVAQLIPILLQPILRRHYSTEDFGAYSIFLSLVGIFVVMSSFKYELAIVLPRKEKDSANVLFITLLINAIFSSILLIVVVAFRAKLLGILNLPPERAIYLYLVPVGVFLVNAYQSINYWLLRKKSFYAISLNKFGRRGFEGITQTLSILLNNSKGLLHGDIIGNLTNVGLGLFQSRRSGFSMKLISIEKIKYLLRKYNYFPKYNLITSLMSAGSFSLPALFINKFYSLEYAGYVDMARMLLSIPMILIAMSLANVLLQRISEKYRNRQSILKDLMPVVAVMLVIGTAEVLIIQLYGVELFTLFFGKQWAFSGAISKILVYSFALNFFVTAFGTLFIAMNRIKILSIWQLVYFSAILSLVLYKDSTFIHFVTIYVSIEAACSLILIAIMIAIVMKYEISLRKQNS